MSESGEEELTDDAAEPSGQPRSWITQGRLLRAVWLLSLPMMGSALLQDLFVLADMVFVGRLGPAAVAAVTVSGTILGIIRMLAMGVVTGCTALVSQAVGAGNRVQAERVAGQALLLMAVLALLVAALGLPLASMLLRALGAEPEVVAAGTSYLGISCAGAFAMLLSVAFGALLRGAGDAVTPLLVIGAANLVNIGLDPIFIFGRFGFPRLGVAGSAWATVLSRALAAAVMAWLFFVRGHEHFHLGLRDLKPHFRTILHMFKIGIYGSGRMLMINLSAIGLVRIVAMFGTVALAAYGIGMRLRMAVMMPGWGVGSAAATLVGQNLGARREDRATRAAWLATGIYVLISLVMTVVFWVFTRPLVMVFNADPQVVAIGSDILRWFSATFVFIALSMVLGRAMSGAGDTFWPMLLTAVTMLGIRIPLAWVLAETLESVTGVWAGLAFSNVIQGLMFGGVFLWGRWKVIGRAHVKAAALEPPVV